MFPFFIMTIQHKNITEDNLHENKGASTAASNTVLVASGNGTSSFSKLDLNMVDGIVVSSSDVGAPLVVGDNSKIAKKNIAIMSAFATNIEATEIPAPASDADSNSAKLNAGLNVDYSDGISYDEEAKEIGITSSGIYEISVYCSGLPAGVTVGVVKNDETLIRATGDASSFITQLIAEDSLYFYLIASTEQSVTISSLTFTIKKL